MISCVDFIPAYSELFKFLERKGGEAAVRDFWSFLSDTYLKNLRDLVAAQGIKGCWLYWAQTLNEEAADFRMELDEAAGEFKIVMYRCPSKGRLLEIKHVEPYRDYCLHCDAIYRRVLEPLGYDYLIDLARVDEARCAVTVRVRRRS